MTRPRKQAVPASMQQSPRRSSPLAQAASGTNCPQSLATTYPLHDATLGAAGIFDMLWAVLLTKCEEFDHELGGVDWRWQSADCC